MKILRKHIVIILIVALWLCSHQVHTQINPDSLLNRAEKLIYVNPDASIALAKQAYDQPNAPVKNKVNALLTISTAYSSKRDYQGAQNYILKIEKILPEIKNQRLKMNVLNRMGAQYQDLQIYDKAIEYLNMSLDLIENYPKKDSVQTLLGYNHTIRGFIYREQMNCNIALVYFDKAIVAYNKTPERFIRNANLSVCYYNKGNCILSMGLDEDAKKSYLKSIAYAKDVNAKSLIAFAQKGMAEVKTTQGKYSEALTILKEALEVSDSVGDLILNRGIYDGLANNYLAINDWDNYTYYNQKFSDLQNQTRTAERKTINQSLVGLAKKNNEEVAELQRFYLPIQILGIIVCIAGLIILIRFITQSEKRLKNLRKHLKD